jgi:hypothetical protein
VRPREEHGLGLSATKVTDMWVRMANLQFSRIIMAWFKLSLRFRFCRHYIPWQHDLSRRIVDEQLKRDGPCKLSPKTVQKWVFFWPI